jgi:prespore-specific regulator
MKRTDSWSPDDDRLLATTVIECVASGSTQGKAFEEAGERLTRSVAACGFRWNSVVRKEYEEELASAKISKKEGKGKIHEEEKQTMDTNSNQTVKEDPFYIIDLALREVKAEMQSIREENELLKRKLRDQPRGEDLAALMEMFDRARSLGLFKDSQSPAM